MAKFLFLGHGSLRFETNSGKIIFVDPYVGEGYDKPADVLLVTHDHRDHNVIEKVTRKPDCLFVNQDIALTDGTYQSFTHNDIQITAVPAYNKNHSPDKCVGYLLQFDGLTLYCTGDTSETKEMATLASHGIDYVFLPVDGIYNMDAAEAARCVEIIGARHAIPIHTDPKGFCEEKASLFNAPGRIIVRHGEEIAL